ncbi:HAMP domain-containing protein [Aurantibacter crassamenti]|uniref:sensor histidine kinase n=1 Tax=Aurantibacter crassamenti TaxID=1837375 RepID=UPI00193AC36A|nr:ATP-binding protein [Aurantibacter crassamenti]MBM1107317.1 HAMP domain-containing protein [Aurantibacter crassamenti]
MNTIKSKLILAFGTTITVLLLVMVLKSQYSKKSETIQEVIDFRIEPALEILHEYRTFNNELFLIALNKISSTKSDKITNRMKVITEVELPHLNNRAFDLIATFPPDDPEFSSFSKIISTSDNAIINVKDMFIILQTNNDYAKIEKLNVSSTLLKDKIALQFSEIDHLVSALQINFNLESKTKKTELNRQLINLNKIIVISSTVAILISVLVAFKTIHSIVKPIKILQDGAKRISKGDYEHRVTLNGKDELNELGDNFNNMANSLSRSFENINSKNKELEQFVYIASHDLQEPLRTISSFSKILTEQYKGQLDDTGEHSLRFISEATSRMQFLVKDLMDYSRLGNDKSLETINCDELILGVQTDLSELIKDTNTDLIFNELPNINGYKTALRLLFQNLINNAMKFQKKGVKPIVEIFYEDDQNFWKFGVKDNGIGIAPEHQSKIFSIFKRLHTNKEYQGTGIGLAHCQKIIEMHKGRIWVESQKNQGSTFYFTLAKNPDIDSVLV